MLPRGSDHGRQMRCLNRTLLVLLRIERMRMLACRLLRRRAQGLETRSGRLGLLFDAPGRMLVVATIERVVVYF
jgi:hypothetical protein